MMGGASARMAVGIKSSTSFWKAYNNSYFMVVKFFTSYAVFGGELTNSPFPFLLVITFIVLGLGKLFWKSQIKSK